MIGYEQDVNFINIGNTSPVSSLFRNSCPVYGKFAPAAKDSLIEHLFTILFFQEWPGTNKMSITPS